MPPTMVRRVLAATMIKAHGCNAMSFAHPVAPMRPVSRAMPSLRRPPAPFPQSSQTVKPVWVGGPHGAAFAAINGIESERIGLAASDDALATFVEDVLFRKDPSYSLTKSELEILFLEADIEISKDMLDDMFKRIDAYGDSLICAQELTDYIQRLEPTHTRGQRALFVVESVCQNLAWWMTLCFLAGSLLSIESNLLGRKGMSLALGRMTYTQLISWLFIAGTSVFTIQSYQRQREAYKLNERAKQALLKWVKWPSGMQGGGDEWSRFFAIDEPTTRKDIESAVRSERSPGILDRFLSTKDGVNLVELQELLERSSIFLPNQVLSDIFREIDQNENGVLCRSELEAFVERNQLKKRSKKSGEFGAVWRRCVRCWEFWSNWNWFAGSTIFVALSYMTNIPRALRMKLVQTGSFFYFAGGFALLPIMYNEVKTYFSYVEDLHDELYSLVVPKGEDAKDVGTLKTLSKRAFDKLDVRDDSGKRVADGKLDCVELYSALSEAGVLIPLNVLLDLFKEADKDGDGRLRLEEFTAYVISLTSPSRRQRRWLCIQKLAADKNFWLSSLYVIAGLLYILNSFGSYFAFSNIMRSNMLLGASMCYAANSLKGLIAVLGDRWRYLKLSDLNSFKFKNVLLQRSKEYSEGAGAVGYT